MMRKLFMVALVTATALGFSLARDASAAVTVDVIFRGTGTNTTAAGGINTADVILTTSTGLIGAFVSVGWDSTSGTTLSSALQWAGGKFPDNTPGAPGKVTISTLGSPGPAGPNGGFSASVGSFSGIIAPPNAPPAMGPGTYNLGTIVWDSTAATGTTIAAILKPGDAIADGNNVTLTPGLITLGTATIGTVIPEPGTAALLGLGLVGLVVSARRKRS